MAKPEPRREPAAGDKGKAKNTKKEKGGTGKLIGRIALYGVLGILLILGFLDFRVKRAAEATGEAWRQVQQDKKIDEEFLQSELAASISGSPTPVTRDAQRMGDYAVDSIVTYTWNGIFRDYKIYVGLGLGSDPTVEGFIGPNDEDPLAGQ